MILKKYQGKLIEKDKSKPDIFALGNNGLEKAVLTKIKVEFNSNIQDLNIFGEVPDYLINKEISIVNSIEGLDDKKMNVTQYLFLKEEGLRIAIRNYTSRSMQYIKV